MGDTNQDAIGSDSMDDFFEPVLGDLTEEEDVVPISSAKQLLAEKRRRAEQRLEERRLRDELGCYDLQFDDY